MSRREQIGRTVRKPDCKRTHKENKHGWRNQKNQPTKENRADCACTWRNCERSCISVGCFVSIFYYASLSLVCFWLGLFNKSSRATQPDNALWDGISHSVLHSPDTQWCLPHAQCITVNKDDAVHRWTMGRSLAEGKWRRMVKTAYSYHCGN